ncbi:MAG: hypothetical protein JXB39_07280 [Deltaproteobacteria bacterium]|nr:hypothetical protein [Deltaproteobacteria bacterium]
MSGFLWLAFLAACGRSEPPSPEVCQTLPKGVQADECWAAALPILARTDPDRAERYADEHITDNRTRDFLFLQITREVDPSTLRWCNRIEEKVVQERCRVLVRRPHLHRALGVEAGTAASGGSPSGPPPGGQPPPATPQGPPPGGPPPASPGQIPPETPPPGSPT